MSTGKYDKDGSPLTLLQWAAKLETPHYSHVALDKIGVVTISTQWLGLDHRFGGDGPPLIFETAIFGSDRQRLDGGGRTSTIKKALAMHAAEVARHT